mmetsp:Transcript_3179/g.5808  ORF Transcript_3179/g.5808 Transcript_3179/m.5808 type:complete len:368 (-) Transcript_3179:203-1306(-)
MARQSPESLVRRLTHHVGSFDTDDNDGVGHQPIPTKSKPDPTVQPPNSRAIEALKQLFCGGMAGSVAKTVTAPLSRLTILYQVHPMVTTKENRPKFSMSLRGGFSKIIERGGVLSLWKGNGTSVLHRFPFSAINFYCYEGMLDILNGPQRLSDDDEDSMDNSTEISTFSRLIAGGVAGCTACVACYPLDLVRTRLTTQLDGQEHYRGITDAFVKIFKSEGFLGLYSGIGPTLMVAVPSFSISYVVYGSLKEYALEDELFYNLRKVDAVSGEEKLGFQLTLMCGAASGTLSTLVTFPFDTVRRRMQIQSLHFAPEERLTGVQMIRKLLRKDGVKGFYRGLTPEVLKVVPMVGTMFTMYEYLKDKLNVS